MPACVWRQGCLLRAKEKGVGWSLGRMENVWNHCCREWDREKHRTGNGRQCENSLEVGVECTVTPTCLHLQEDECND